MNIYGLHLISHVENQAIKVNNENKENFLNIFAMIMIIVII